MCVQTKVSTSATEKRGSHLPETVRAAQITQVSVGGHPGVELTAQNDGGCRKTAEERKSAIRSTAQEDRKTFHLHRLEKKGKRLLSDLSHK